MTDEKEAVKRIKNSFNAGMSRSQITGKLQQKKYKLEYIDALIKKAERPRKILITSIVTLALLLSMVAASYSFIYHKTRGEVSNPLEGLKISFNSQSSSQGSTPLATTNGEGETNIDDIEITPEFISYLLNEIGAWKLHKHPLTFKKPIINFKIGELTFYSTFSKKIETKEGTSDSADLQFNTNKEELVRAILSDTPQEVFKKSISDGNTQIELLASETELFAKGYKGLYDSLK